MLFPPNIDELVPSGHPVRIVDSIIDKVDIQSILDTYPGGGSSGYHPRMLLKVLVYAYLRNIYSSRQIEESLKENIHFMWISGMSNPDHNTINRFRGKRLDGNLKEIFGFSSRNACSRRIPEYKRGIHRRNQDGSQC